MFNLRTRTTSALESYNARLGKNIPAGANFFNFAKCLINEEATKKIEFRDLIASGGGMKLTTRQTERQRAIEEANEILTHGTLDDFLSRVAFASGTKDLLDNFNINDVADDAHAPDNSDAAPEPILGQPSTSALAQTPTVATASTSTVRRIDTARAQSPTVASRVRQNPFVDDEWQPPSRSRRIDNDASSAPRILRARNIIRSQPVSAPGDPMVQGQTNAAPASNTAPAASVVQVQPNGNNTSSVNDTFCIICLDKKREVAFLPCGHTLFCKECYDVNVIKQIDLFYEEEYNERRSAPPASCSYCRVTIDNTILIKLC